MADWMIFVIVGCIAAVAMYMMKKRKKAKDMPAGIQIFDANGNKTLDYTESLTRISGTICPRTITGSYTIDNPNNERIWLDVYSINTTTDSFFGYCPISISINGNTISWTYSTQSSNKDLAKHLDVFGFNIRYGTF